MLKPQLYLTNSLTKSQEPFQPRNESMVTMYVCGPTLYSPPHIGNLRSAVVYDLLYRVLLQLYPDVLYVRNLTDLEDKITKTAAMRGLSCAELSNEVLQVYNRDLTALNCLKPPVEPKATEHVLEMIRIIQRLISNGYAYMAQGNVLFDTSKYRSYGELSNRSPAEMLAGARVEVASYKENPMDFVLWKPAEQNELCFDSPWGKGRPGWHIECSAMSTKYLGENFDIHGGGVDIMFPHHENEIAQNKCAFEGSSFARYWIHNGSLTTDGKKMSKSLGNDLTLPEVTEKYGPDANAVRYFFMTVHYRKQLDFNDKAIRDAMKAMRLISQACATSSLEEILEVRDRVRMPMKDYNRLDQIMNPLLQDLNTPISLAFLNKLAKNVLHNGTVEDKEILLASCFVLGFDVFEMIKSIAAITLPAEVLELITKRNVARSNNNWKESDRLRNILKLECGYEIRDLSNGEYQIFKVGK